MFVTVSLLLVAVCLLPAVGKLTGQPKMRQSAEHFGIPWSKYRLIGWPNSPPPRASWPACGGIPLGLAAAGIALLLLGALITHRRAADSGKEMAPALLGLAITIAYLVIALAS